MNTKYLAIILAGMGIGSSALANKNITLEIESPNLWGSTYTENLLAKNKNEPDAKGPYWGFHIGRPAIVKSTETAKVSNLNLTGIESLLPKNAKPAAKKPAAKKEAEDKIPVKVSYVGFDMGKEHVYELNNSTDNTLVDFAAGQIEERYKIKINNKGALKVALKKLDAGTIGIFCNDNKGLDFKQYGRKLTTKGWTDEWVNKCTLPKHVYINPNMIVDGQEITPPEVKRTTPTASAEPSTITAKAKGKSLSKRISNFFEPKVPADNYSLGVKVIDSKLGYEASVKLTNVLSLTGAIASKNYPTETRTKEKKDGIFEARGTETINREEKSDYVGIKAGKQLWADKNDGTVLIMPYLMPYIRNDETTIDRIVNEAILLNGKEVAKEGNSYAQRNKKISYGLSVGTSLKLSRKWPIVADASINIEQDRTYANGGIHYSFGPRSNCSKK